MSDAGPGPGWWMASDGRWYPPELFPATAAHAGGGTGAGDPVPQGWHSAGVSGPAPAGYAAPASYCVTCGGGLVATAATCPRCGTPVAKPKSRSVAVVMAIFLSFWSFLYTYRTSAWKFWLGLGLSVGLFTVDMIVRAAVRHPVAGVGAVWLLVGAGVWIWSIVDRATSPL